MIELDKNKIQIKYITGLNKTLEGYPTPLDILYDSCVESVDDCLFSTDKMIEKYGITEGAADDVVSTLLENGYIEKGRNKYKIINNIWL